MTPLITTAEIELIARRTARRSLRVDVDLVLAVLRESGRIAPTLFSAWASDGRPVTLTMSAVIEEEVGRLRRAAATSNVLAASHPDVVVLKGESIAGLYPSDVIRETRDLDMFVPTLPELWKVGRDLIAAGYVVVGLTLRKSAGSPNALLVLERHRGPWGWPDRVELGTQMFTGDVPVVPPQAIVTTSSPAVRNIILLTEERFQRPYIARDFVDAIVLLRSLSASEWSDLRTTVLHLGVAPELAELLSSLRQLGFTEAASYERVVSRPAVDRALNERRRRLWRKARTPIGIIEIGQRMMLSNRLGRVRASAWTRMVRTAGGTRLWRAGVAFFAQTTGSGPADTFEVRVGHRTPFASATTPVGSFVLSPGGVIDL